MILLTRVFIFLVILGRWVAAAEPAATARPDPDRIVVMISVDGLAAYYLDDPKAEMPTIRALAAAGARATMMKASAPTVTWPNHTTLVTGVTPARHGVVGNNYFDRVTGKKVTLISDPVFDKDEIVKVPTLYDLAKAAGMKTAAIRWPATRNAHALDWTLPDISTDELLRKFTTPSLLVECEKAGIDLFGEDPKEDPHAPDMMIFAELGCAFGDTAAGELPFTEKPERKGSHGHDPNLPDLHATFVAWGAGIKAGARLGEISNISVAPTIAKLLGLTIPNVEGKPLSAAMED